MMEIKESVALVTGANRGIGRAFVRALVDHGAAKVYAGARDPAAVVDADVTPLRLDVTNPADITAAAAFADDVTIVINNAGVFGSATKLLEGSFDPAHQEMEVNYFGTWAVSRAFAPILARNGGGALGRAARVSRIRRFQSSSVVIDAVSARRPARTGHSGGRGTRGLRGNRPEYLDRRAEDKRGQRGRADLAGFGERLGRSPCRRADQAG